MKKVLILIVCVALIGGVASQKKPKEVVIVARAKNAIDAEFDCIREDMLRKQDSIFLPLEKDLRKIEKIEKASKKKPKANLFVTL